MRDVETGYRGYLITGDRTYLDPFRAGATAAPEHVRQLRTLFAGDDEQLRRLDRVGTLVRLKTEFSKRSHPPLRPGWLRRRAQGW
jgi:CHASE3 domain sensor protein